MSTYEVLCKQKRHVHVFDERGLKETFGLARATERIEDEQYPLVVENCDECLEEDRRHRLAPVVSMPTVDLLNLSDGLVL